MENVFPLSFGTVFTAMRKLRFCLYRHLPRRIGLLLEERAIDRLYGRLVRRATDGLERQHLEGEHSFESELTREKRAGAVTGRITAQAKRMYLEVPPLTGRDNDANWIRGSYTGLYFLGERAVADLRARVRTERKASWEPWLLWTAALSGWITAFMKG